MNIYTFLNNFINNNKIISESNFMIKFKKGYTIFIILLAKTEIFKQSCLITYY